MQSLTFRGQSEMPIVSPNGLSFYFIVWHGHLNCYQAKSQRPAYGMLGDVPAYFRHQHMVS